MSEPGARAPVTAAVSWDAFLSTYLPALILAIGSGVALPAVPILAKSFDVSFGADPTTFNYTGVVKGNELKLHTDFMGQSIDYTVKKAG